MTAHPDPWLDEDLYDLGEHPPLADDGLFVGNPHNRELLRQLEDAMRADFKTRRAKATRH